MVLTENIIRNLVLEELSKGEISTMISNKIDDKISSPAFKKTIKGLASDVVNELFKILWQRNTTWKNAVTNS